jgi:hypothetical protein
MKNLPPEDEALLVRIVNALRNADTERLRDAIRPEASAIRRLLSRREVMDALSERLPEETAPERLCALYETLGEESRPAGDEPTERVAFSAYDRGLEAIGVAFAEVLLPRLEGRWFEPFRKRKLRNTAVQASLAESPDVLLGGEEALLLLDRGITPGMLFAACNAVSVCLQRVLKRRTDAAAQAPIWLSRDEGLWFTMNRQDQLMEHEDFLAYVGAYAKGPSDAGQAFYDWSRMAAQVAPFLYRGFVAHSVSGELVVSATRKSWADPISRLRPTDAGDEALGVKAEAEVWSFFEWRRAAAAAAVPAATP